MAESTTTTLIAIRDTLGASCFDRSSRVSNAFSSGDVPIGNTPDLSRFSLPEPLTQRLVSLGIPQKLALSLSEIYMRKAGELKLSTLKLTHTACSRLAAHQQGEEDVSTKIFQQQVVDAHYQHYKKTLSTWAQEILVRTSVTEPSDSTACLAKEHTKFDKMPPTRKPKRQFKSEYLPLFEFAFEKDRFPSREDKKCLARISGMSYRQVNVWFQNRRCRQSSRAKSHHTTSAPKTFEEMKARLGPSVQAALSHSNLLTKKLNPDLADSLVIGAPVLMQSSLRASPLRELPVLDDMTPPVEITRSLSLEATSTSGSTSRAVSLEATEVATTPESTTRAVSLGLTDDGFASDERDESSDEDALAASLPQRPAIVRQHLSPPQKQNPLNPFRTSVHAFPTPYAPSQLTSDPFIVEHHPWLRDPRTNPRKFIDPTPETMEEIVGDFDHMDVDDPDATVNATDEQLSLPPRQRVVSAKSSATWSSGESTAASRAPSYSSSVRSSSQFSDADPASPSECTTLEVAECASSSPVTDKTSLPGSDAETSAGSPGEDSKTAGPSVTGLEEVSPLQSSFLKDKLSFTDSKWEALLAAIS